MQAHNIAFSKKFFERINVGDADCRCRCRVWVGVVGDDFTSHTQREDLAREKTDAAGADEADRLLIEIEAD